MITEITLPPGTTNMARSLEERFRVLRVPGRKVPWSEWVALAPAIQSQIPTWIPTLLSNYPFVGGALECRHDLDDCVWMRWFSFFGPSEYEKVLTSGDEILRDEILAKGLAPISHEEDGNMWVTSINGGVLSPIYLFHLSGMENMFASSRVELLLASMGVSEMSYPDAKSKTSVMWYPEK